MGKYRLNSVKRGRGYLSVDEVFLIRLILETTGALWLLLVVMIGIFGGKVDIQLKNPFTKKLETITDVIIEHN